MKKIIILSILILFTSLLSSCFQDEQAVKDAKKELGIFNKNNTGIITNESEDKKSFDNIKEVTDSVLSEYKNEENTKNTKKKEQKFIIENITSNNFIELDDLNSKTYTDGEIEITGKTLLNVDKIEVSFINKTSDFPVDNYTLRQFKPGDKTFKYRAFSRYQTLDYGKNEYVFTAYSGEEVSKLSLIINLINPEDTKSTNNEIKENNVVFEKKSIGDGSNIKYLNFPKSKAFGEMVSTGEKTFTYSNIDNLNVEKRDVSNIQCSNITDELTSSINGWFYWNTCRNIIKDKGIKFNVIRLEGDKYFYERHYVDYNNSFYGVFLIETGTGITKDNIKEKNNELKLKEFNSVKLVDNLFYEIVR